MGMLGDVLGVISLLGPTTPIQGLYNKDRPVGKERQLLRERKLSGEGSKKGLKSKIQLLHLFRA